MNEVHDVQPGHIYQPGNKKKWYAPPFSGDTWGNAGGGDQGVLCDAVPCLDVNIQAATVGPGAEVRLVYRILSGPYCGRHQKSFSLTKWGVAGAWDAAQQAKAYMLQTGRLPPSFASPYSRSKLTNASANAIVLSKPLQPPRPLIHPGAVAGGHARADAAALLASAATGAHLSLDTANAAIAAAASRFLPLETFSAVAAAARSLPPHPTHGEKDGAAPALPYNLFIDDVVDIARFDLLRLSFPAFPTFSDGLAAPFPSFLPPPTFPGRTAAGASPPGSWSYLSSVHATLAATAVGQRASGAGSEALARRENAGENAATGHDSCSPTLGQENCNGSACAEARICDIATDRGDGGASVINSYVGRVPAHSSELIGLHMLPSAPGPPSPFTTAPTADGVTGTALPSSSSPPVTANTGTTCTTGEVNPAAAAATAFTLLQLAEQNAVLPQAKDQQQLNHSALQHFMLLHQLQLMQEKQQKDTQQRQGGHESLYPLKPSPLQGYASAGEEVDGASGESTESAEAAEETGEAAETDRHVDAACAANATASAESDLAPAGSVEPWQNENCSPAAMGGAPPPSHDVAQLRQGSLTCRTSQDTLSQTVGSVPAVPDTFALLRDQRRHQQHHPQQQEPHKQDQQDHPQSGQVFAEEGNFEATPGMRETLRDLLIAASLQQQRLHQQQLAVAEHLHSHHPHVATLAMKGLPLGRPGTATPAPPGMLNISTLASLLPGAVLSHKQQTAADGMLTQNPSPNHTEGNTIGGGCCVHPGPGEEPEQADPSALAEEKPNNTLLSEGIHAGKDVGLPSQLSVLWGIPQLDHLGVKNRDAMATAAAARGHCGGPSGSTVSPSLETASALASPATVEGEHFTLVDDSAAATAAARLKGLNECAGVILHHPAASSSPAAADVEGECEAMSSCQSGNGDECEKGGEELFQPERIRGDSRQPSLLQSLSPPPLQMLRAGSAAASPLRIAAAIDGSAVSAAAPISGGGHCHTLMHPGQDGAKTSPVTVRERATAVSGEGAAAVTDAAALQICSSPNNTPSRSSGTRVQPYSAAAAADACSHLRGSGRRGSGGALLSRNTDSRGRNMGNSSLVSGVLRIGPSMAVEASVTESGAHEMESCRRIATDAAGEEGMCNRTYVTREGRRTDGSGCATASAPKGPDSSNVLDELAIGANEVARNGTDTEDEDCSNSTRSDGTQELDSRCSTSNPSRSNGSELRRRREASFIADADTAPARESCWISCIKRNRTGRCAYGSVADSLSSDSQDEEQIVRTRSKTADGKKPTSGSADLGRIRTLGKHHTRRKMCF